jgi:asparagine synthase (glutamine-hydrolysing)
MAGALTHRGPDSAGVWTEPESGLALAHRRLAIIDVTQTGAQPMLSHSGRYAIALNGEIYNHPELRAEFDASKEPPAWRGHSDTETLLTCVDRWGFPGCLPRIDGMFAFALWDRHERVLYLARDRMGEKPLYYGRCGDAFLFASELTALRAFPRFENAVDLRAVASFLRYSYVPGPGSIYRGIRKLPPGSFVRFKALATCAEPSPEAYWSVESAARKGVDDPLTGDYGELRDGLEETLKLVVRSQMISDVPLGALLSGGIDSSLLVALMQIQSERRIKTFSIGFDVARFDEAAHARAVAQHLGTDHAEFVLTEADALAVVPALGVIFDEPFADSSQIPSILLSRMTRSSVTVALSGDGGDEVFGGYNRYAHGPGLWHNIRSMPRFVRKALGLSAIKLQRFTTRELRLLPYLSRRLGLPLTLADKLSKLGGAVYRAESFAELYRELVSTFHDPQEIMTTSEGELSSVDLSEAIGNMLQREEWMMAMDSITYLPDDILVKVDRADMSASLEIRATYLDRRVVEHAWRLPLSAKITKNVGKRILRDILYLNVPRSLIERPKQGFSIPLDLWLRGRLRAWAEDLLSPAKLAVHGYLKVDEVTRLWQGHLAGTDNAGARLWNVLMLQSWLNRPRP